MRIFGITVPALVVMMSISVSAGAADTAPGGAVAEGPFKPDWESLKQYKCPEWFRDAKLGIWAVWGPEAVPEQGDWYARNMYIEGSGQYKYHVEHFGHPSQFGFKDVIPLWKAEKWDPDHLMQLYKKAGARYFCVIANHHDNFDCWDSKFHKWNSVNMGPQRDVAGEWKKAADKYGLRFGVTEHLGASYSWYTVTKKADKQGPLAGVPYDGADPKYADLYHAGNENAKGWYAENAPEAWKQEWFNRIKDLIDSYHPDLLYSDGSLPFGDYGRRLLAHFYNANMRQHGGRLEAVYNCKFNRDGGEYAEGAVIQDLERGVLDGIKDEPWQTDTCVGGWYYHKGAKYKSPQTVIQMLVDIVSKNGNLLLNFPPRPDGSLDDDELKILDEMARWMDVNGEAIFGTRPWKIFGEGSPQAAGGHFNEGKMKYTAEDLRFTTKGDTIYAVALGWPGEKFTIRSMGRKSPLVAGEISDIRLLGHAGKLEWSRTDDALEIKVPAEKPCDLAYALKITGLKTSAAADTNGKP